MQNTESESISIMVVSFDDYSDVWPAFFKCKSTYWLDCPYKTYMVSNFKKIENVDCEFILIGKETNWCDRATMALNKIKAETIILLLEDYLIGEKICNKDVERYIDFWNTHDCKYLRMLNIQNKYSTKNTAVMNSIFPILSSEEYGINLQPSIWNRSFLLQMLKSVGGDRSAWDFEVMLLKRCKKENPVLLEGCYAATNNVLHIHNGVLKGKWFPNEVTYFQKKGINILSSERKKLSIFAFCEYKFRLWLRNKITPTSRKKLKKLLKIWGFKFASNE